MDGNVAFPAVGRLWSDTQTTLDAASDLAGFALEFLKWIKDHPRKTLAIVVGVAGALVVGCRKALQLGGEGEDLNIQVTHALPRVIRLQVKK
jgi:hypothetical protein